MQIYLLPSLFWLLQLTGFHVRIVVVVLRLDEVRQDIFVAPSLAALLRPSVIVVTAASDVQHAV